MSAKCSQNTYQLIDKGSSDEKKISNCNFRKALCTPVQKDLKTMFEIVTSGKKYTRRE